MTAPAGRLLDGRAVLGLFQELSDRLEAEGLRAQLFVVGGAAMALAYDQGRLTRDVDAVFAPAPEVRRIAEAMGSDLALEPDWLNDAAKGFMPGPDEAPTTGADLPGLCTGAQAPLRAHGEPSQNPRATPRGARQVPSPDRGRPPPVFRSRTVTPYRQPAGSDVPRPSLPPLPPGRPTSDSGRLRRVPSQPRTAPMTYRERHFCSGTGARIRHRPNPRTPALPGPVLGAAASGSPRVPWTVRDRP
jgi:hypothetical protein